MADLRLYQGCIARPVPNTSTSQWYTVISRPYPGGNTTAVSTKGEVIETNDLPLERMPTHMLRSIEADVASCMGCRVIREEKRKGLLTYAKCACGGPVDSGAMNVNKYPFGPHAEFGHEGLIKQYMTRDCHAAQILAFVTRVTDDVRVKWMPDKECWAVKIGDSIAYGSLASAASMAWLGWNNVVYIRGRTIRVG